MQQKWFDTFFTELHLSRESKRLEVVFSILLKSGWKQNPQNYEQSWGKTAPLRFSNEKIFFIDYLEKKGKEGRCNKEFLT